MDEALFATKHVAQLGKLANGTDARALIDYNDTQSDLAEALQFATGVINLSSAPGQSNCHRVYTLS